MTVISLNGNGFVLQLETLDSPERAEPNRFKGVARAWAAVGTAAQGFRTEVDCPIPDLDRLCAFVDAHVQRLLKHATQVQMAEGLRDPLDTPPWVTMDLEMEVRLMDGEVDLVGDTVVGGFAVLVLLNIGTDTSGTRVYGGFQGEVDVREMLAFCRAVRARLVSLG